MNPLSSLSPSARRFVAVAVGIACAIWIALPLVRPPPFQRGVDTQVAVEPRPTLIGASAPTKRDLLKSNEVDGTSGTAGETDPTVSGRVSRADGGGPIAGARVFVSTDPVGVVGLEQTVLSDRNGRFSVPVSKEAADERWIAVRAAGFLAYRSRLPDRGLSGKRLSIGLERGASLRGTVVDRGGVGISGVRVTAASPVNRVTWPSQRDVFSVDPVVDGSSAISGHDGAFEVRGLLEGRRYVIRAEREGYIWEHHGQPALAAYAGDETRLVMLRTTALWVQITDKHTGQPIPVASFSLRPNWQARRYARPIADEDPIFENRPGVRTVMRLYENPTAPWKSEAPVEHRLFVHAPAYAPWSGTVVTKWNETREFRVELSRRSTETLEEPVPVRFYATLGTDMGFSGRLVMRLRSRSPGIDPESAAGFVALGLTFREGEATRVHHLLPGSYAGFLRGPSPEARWWSRPGKIVEFDVPASSRDEHRVSFRVDGARLVLDVRDSAGRAVRGYSVEVMYADMTGGGLYLNWDRPGRSQGVDGTHAWTAPVLWVQRKPGTVRIVHPGLGRAQAKFDALPSGVEHLVSLKLDGEDFNLAGHAASMRKKRARR